MFGKKIVTIKKEFPADTADLEKTAREYVCEELAKLGIGKRLMMKSALLTEESVIQFRRFAKEGARLHIKIKHFLGDTSVVLSMEGDEFDPYAEEKEDLDGEEEITENTIRSILLRSYGEAFKYTHRNRLNNVRILTGRSEQRSLRITFIALVLGIVFGVFAKLVLPEAATAAICSELFEPVKTLFLKALQRVIAPVVFFSIASCISQFGNLMELGRIGLKVFGIYLLTSAIAVCLGMGAANLIQPGEPGFALSLASEESLEQLGEGFEPSIKNIIMNIIPKNFIEPFYTSDTLQIIFLAVVCGIAVGMTGEHSSRLRGMFDTLNSLFLTVTTIISRFIPVAVFCSLGLLIMKVGGKELLSVLS
ncbi:MAG: cation:dicarboxylase symporter family transporter [Ruminococcus sp.]|nr:cation:dicarboxylase symporter family transporter [Ruminococcus sp.]